MLPIFKTKLDYVDIFNFIFNFIIYNIIKQASITYNYSVSSSHKILI